MMAPWLSRASQLDLGARRADEPIVRSSRSSLRDPVPEYRTRTYALVLKLVCTPAAAFLVLLGVGDIAEPASVWVGVTAVVFDLSMAAALVWAAWLRSRKVGLVVEPDGFRLQRQLRNLWFARGEVRRFEVDRGLAYLVPREGLRLPVLGLGAWSWRRSGRTFELVDELNAMLPPDPAAGQPATGAAPA